MHLSMERTSASSTMAKAVKMPILAVVGIRTTGEREMLRFRVGDRENQQAWEDLLEDLKTRGVQEINL